MANNYKKYMKKPSNNNKEYSLIKLFAISFFGMLLVFTFLIKSFSPSVDVSIGDYKQEADLETPEEIKSVDDRLAMIQDEDQGKNFRELMKNTEEDSSSLEKTNNKTLVDSVPDVLEAPAADPVYKVYIGSYSSAEQAKVARDIIKDAGLSLNPLVKCIGSNDYTLQVGLYKDKIRAENELAKLQQNHLPCRIVQEY